MNNSIGVFDSGIGGLSVLRHIRQLLPHESLIYFADSAFAPYGDKTEEQIKERSLKIAQFLIDQHIKALVVACNTATAAAINVLRSTFPDLIIIGIEPGLKPAALLSQTKKIGVMATRRTLESQKFKLLRDQLSTEMHVQFCPQACVGLVDLIEQGKLNSTEMHTLLENYIEPLLAQNIDSLVLGCTHYPFALPQIKAIIHSLQEQKKTNTPHSIHIIDTGVAVARRLQKLLEDNQLLNGNETKQSTVTLWGTSQFDGINLAEFIPELTNKHFKKTVL